jgi:hypothetical protein
MLPPANQRQLNFGDNSSAEAEQIIGERRELEWIYNIYIHILMLPMELDREYLWRGRGLFNSILANS